MRTSDTRHPAPDTLLLVGCGKMGGALLARWLQQFPESRFTVVAPRHAQRNTPQVTWYKTPESLPQDYAPDVIVFAVKPQQLSELLPLYGSRFGNASLYLSIAAGKTLAFLASHLGGHAHIVRAMPNMPALIGQGMSLLCAADTLPASARAIATQLMQAAGKAEWLDEPLMDAATALSGCGPAYVFLFLESLVRAAVGAGLPEDKAKTLALQTVSGSVALAGGSHESFEQLRQAVASPGGMTEAALEALMENDAMAALLREAITAAIRRSEELSRR